jgi:hypothetical protein
MLPHRRRGVKPAYGTLAQVGAGCICPDCRAASAALQRDRERRQADEQFLPEKRATLDRARPAEIEHGRQSAYGLGCRCSECRAAR